MANLSRDQRQLLRYGFIDKPTDIQQILSDNSKEIVLNTTSSDFDYKSLFSVLGIELNIPVSVELKLGENIDDLTQYPIQHILLKNNTTLPKPTNIIDGSNSIIILQQDEIGGHKVTTNSYEYLLIFGVRVPLSNTFALVFELVCVVLRVMSEIFE